MTLENEREGNAHRIAGMPDLAGVTVGSGARTEAIADARAMAIQLIAGRFSKE